MSSYVGQWIHVAGAYQYGQIMQLYVNDQFASELLTSIASENTPGYDVTLGGKYLGVSTGLLIYEVQISNVARYTSTRVNAKNNSLPPVEFELEQNYPNPFNPDT